MRKLIKHTIIKFITYFMIGIMGMHIANKAIFLHTHKLNDGTIITHAHPYDKSSDSKPYKSHHHTNAEFIFFQNLEILFLIVFIPLALITHVKMEEAICERIAACVIICMSPHRGRAPPLS